MGDCVVLLRGRTDSYKRWNFGGRGEGVGGGCSLSIGGNYFIFKTENCSKEYTSLI